MQFINIDVDLVPYKFEITINNKSYVFEFEYNTVGKFFTVNLLYNDKVLVLGEKILYGKPLFTNIKYKNIPDVTIVPIDLSNQYDTITYKNFGNNVKLYLVSD